MNGGDEEALSRLMQTLEGDFAKAYNLRKGRSGAFWSDRYHAVMVERGEYLWRCLRYIDLNMVRAGVVRSPADWNWCGYQEVAGLRVRYRVVDRELLAEALGPGNTYASIAAHYLDTVAEALRRTQLEREPWWTESLAVGGEAYIRDVAALIRNRMEIEMRQEGTVWLAREARSAYSHFSPTKTAAKTHYGPQTQA